MTAEAAVIRAAIDWARVRYRCGCTLDGEVCLADLARFEVEQRLGALL